MAASSGPYSPEDEELARKFAWYHANIDEKFTTEILDVLENYSLVPRDEIRKHIYEVRKECWKLSPWPCTGLGGFLVPTIKRHPVFDSLISRLRSADDTATFLDVGCYMGTDLRAVMLADGGSSLVVAQNKLFGADIVNLWDTGLDFFRDRDRLTGVKFIQTDIINPSEELMKANGGKGFEFMYLNYVLHNMTFENQVKACTTLVQLSQPGSVIFGFQAGAWDAERREIAQELFKESGTKVHDPASFAELWEHVGELTGSRWVCAAEMVPWDRLGYDAEKDVAYLGKEMALLEFSVKRLDG